jgi:DNA-directed RNA polymerase specialized sigma subunit
MDPDRKAQSQQVKSTLGADTYRVCRLRMRRLTQHQIGRRCGIDQSNVSRRLHAAAERYPALAPKLGLRRRRQAS